MKPTDDELEAMAAKLDAIHIVTGVRANRDILGTRPIEAANDAQREAAALLRACKTGDAPTDERVKALEAENARLRIALQQIVGGEIYTAADGFSKPHEPEQSRIARAALRDMDATP